MTTRLRLMSSVALMVLLVATPAYAQTETPPTPPAEEGESEIVVTGIKASLEESINQKRNAETIIDTINAEDIGKLPDENIAESLQRVTGVQINRGFDNNPGDNFGSGEGTQVSVRGIRPDLNRTLLNGGPVATNTDGRNFDFSVISPQLVKRLEVIKAPSASMIEGSLGAIVNQVTRRPLDSRNFELAASAQLEVPEFTEDKGYRASVFASLPITGTLGILAGYNRTDVEFQRHRYESAGWSERVTGITDTSGVARAGLIPINFRYNNRIEDTTRDNYFASLQWQPSDELELNLDFLKAKSSDHNYGVQPILPAEIGTQRLTNAVFEGDVVVAATVTPLAAANRYRRMLAIDRFNDSISDSYAGDLKWTTDAAEVVLKAGYSEGKFDQFFNIFNQFWGNDSFTFDYRDGLPKLTISPGGFLFANPANYIVGLSNRSINQFTDREKYAQFDLTVPTENFGFISALRAGLRWNDHRHTSVQANDVTTAAERAGVTLADFILPPVPNAFSIGREGGVPSDFPAIDFAKLIARFDPVLQTLSSGGNQAPSNYSLDESVMAMYAQADFEAGSVSGNIGVRYVLTDQDNLGNIVPPSGVPQAVRFGRSYSDILPSLNLNWEASDKLQVRFGLSKAMARPSIRDLNLGGNVIPLASEATINNPELDPFRAKQADLSVEWYFEPQGLLSAALFYKDIESFVEIRTRQDTIPGFGDQVFTIRSLVNGSGAKLKGAEFSFQKNFNFLPSPLDGFGTLLNYTYVDAPTKTLDPVTGEALQLAGVSKHAANLILFYEKGGFEARVAYSFRSEYIAFSSVGSYTINRAQPNQAVVGLPQYRDAFSQLDANVSYRIPGTGITVFAAARNLLNDATYDFQRFGDQELFSSYHKSGRVYTGGVRFRL